ncbi:hypothetical protein HY29_11965 [Hyphomonas beringensis]|uniref:Uncharacterized protein n=1 Tax=Hyphomonas beringensis TaxID=1280946 RepID=A0A062UCI6_9PROT|nr:hypothetical protein [Hyphomonas beringensis]KCZ55433.1 hypothetical protein HY29_11965 [Hyphomonas beringensis]
MSNPDFINHGLEQARYALTNIIGMTNAQLRPRTLPRSLKQRASGRLSQLEMIVRRLLFLMALMLGLPAPAEPRKTEPRQLPEGTEIVSFPTQRRFALSAKKVAMVSDAVFLQPPFRDGQPVLAAPFLARIAALYRVLKDPDAHAKRLARCIARQKQAGEPAPQIMPIASAYRLRPELGIVSAALPGMIRALLQDWCDTS